MKKLRSTFLIFMLVLGMCVTSVNPVFAVEKQEKDLSGIIKKVEMINNKIDQLGKPLADFKEDAMFVIDLSYQEENAGEMTIDKGDRLLIELEPESDEKDLIHMKYSTSVKNELVDTDKKVKVASLDMLNRKGVEFTFEGGIERFSAKLELPYQLNSTRMWLYFNEHPDEKSVNVKYQLKINNKPVEGKTLELTIHKPNLGESTVKFTKTGGTYHQVGELGDGYFSYNIKLGTNLQSPNEYVIYDAPDVNLGFDGNMQIYSAPTEGGFQDLLFANENTDPDGTFESSNETANGTKVNVYDVYFVSEESQAVNQNRHPGWEEKKFTFENRLDENGKPMESLSTGTVPKNILFEKPLGSPLTAEEQQLIDSQGGLYKKVAKGFKVTISDFKSNYYEKGGYITFYYEMGIKGASNEINKKGNPIYRNSATFYGQEIPNCKPEDTECKPITYEKTKKDDIGSPDRPTSSEVQPGTIGADVEIPPVIFTKVEADAAGNPIKEKPLADAIFSIYKADETGEKGEIARNQDGATLENLVTNADGKLTKDGKEIPLTLEKGYYILTEVSAPKGYEILKKDTNITVSYKTIEVTVGNKKQAAPEPQPPVDPDPEPQPPVDPDPEPDPAPDPEPQPPVDPDPEPDPAPDPEPQPPVEPDPAPDPEPQPPVDPDPEPDPAPDPEPQPPVDPDPEPDPAPDPEPQPPVDPDPEPDSKPDTNPPVESEKPDSTPQAEETTDHAPQSGDAFNVTMPIVLLLISGLVIAGSVLVRSKKRK